MKQLYSFDVERQVEEMVPYTRKGKNGPVESTKKVKKKYSHKVVIEKPSMADVENAEFFYGQKFNQYINSGFLTKAMLIKKMDSLSSGVTTKDDQERIQKLIYDNVEAARVIEFYGGASNLTEAQEEKLKEAKMIYGSSKKELTEYEYNLRQQFAQTADSKAEQKLIEWFVFNFSHFEDEVDGDKDMFCIFEGENYAEKRENYLQLSDSDNDNDNAAFIKYKSIFDKSFQTLIRVITIWYNKMGTDQESIQESMDDLFKNEEQEIEDFIKSKKDIELKTEDVESRSKKKEK